MSGATYKEIAEEVAKRQGRSYVRTKAVDNALLRIRKKATLLIETGKIEEMPLFIV